MSKNNSKNMIIAALVAIVLTIGALAFLNAPDERSAGEHIDDAIENLNNGVDDAARELQDRTPAERIHDEYKDATDGNAE